MKNKLLLLALCLVGCGAATTVSAQTTDPVLARRQAWEALAQPGSTREWLRLRDDTRFTAQNFFTENAALLGLASTDDMRLLEVETDALDMTHHRFAQYAFGHKVYGGEYTLHEKDGRISTANGKLFATPAAPAPSLLGETAALEQALQALPTRLYRWLDPEMEAMLQQRENDPSATFFPAGELVWIPRQPAQPADPGAAPELVLTWKFDVYTLDDHSARLFLDAQTGELRWRIPLSTDCDPASGATTWNGTVNFNSSQVGMNFVLHDDCQGPNIRVRNGNFSLTPNVGATNFTDADNNWGGQQSALQTFFGLQQTWQYFLTSFGRNSFNGAGANIEAYNNSNFGNAMTANFANASWNGSFIRIGDHDGTGLTPGNDWNTIDIVGHEFTHAVTGSEGVLDYIYESGALNESFSDIFGEMTEIFAEGTAPDWLVGGDRGAIRDMEDPKLGGQPDTYLGVSWFSTTVPGCDTIDACGVHTNSGVQNHWFYLLSAGGADVNDNGDNYLVQGIGTASAAAIAYRNLTVYLGTSSTHADAKSGAIQAARDLFGDCSNEVLQCARAWDAVGVYSSDVIGYDIAVDCPALSLVHILGLPYLADAANDVRADCNILANGALVTFEAGHAVVLKPGFRSGDNFRAFINPCGAPKPALSPVTAIQRTETRPAGIHAQPATALEAFPNPFTQQLNVRFTLAEPASADLVLRNALGSSVYAWPRLEQLAAGTHTADWHAADLPPGLYYLELHAAGVRSTVKLVKAHE